jgi:hypothetical protein
MITDKFNDEITQINEGESFYVTLIASGFAAGTDISYTITGVVPEDLSGTDTRLTGIFNNEVMTREFNIVNDLSTDGKKNMVFTTNFNNPAIFTDVSATLLINDTSQSPEYKTASNMSHPNQASTFQIIFEITNYSLLTSTQKHEQLSFMATVINSEGVSVTENAISGLFSGRIISSNGTFSALTGIMSHTFTYTCLTPDKDTFLFTIGNSSTTLKFN